MVDALKNRDRNYWEARKESQKEANNFITSIDLWVVILSALFILTLSPFKNKDWPETNAIVKNVSIQQGTFINKTTYIYELEYEIEGKKIIGLRPWQGSKKFQKGDIVTVLVNPKNYTNPYLKESDDSKFRALVLCSIMIIACSFILIRRKNKKTKTI